MNGHTIPNLLPRCFIVNKMCLKLFMVHPQPVPLQKGTTFMTSFLHAEHFKKNNTHHIGRFSE